MTSIPLIVAIVVCAAVGLLSYAAGWVRGWNSGFDEGHKRATDWQATEYRK